MADVNKTIEISMTADLKSLQKQLSKIPGMTKEEAKAMTKALQRELRQAQAAAKKTADVNKRAMKQVVVANNQAAKSAKNLRMQSREMGGAFGALEDVLGEVAPELAGTAMAVGTLGSAFRALSRSMATGNPIVLALISATAAAAAAYHLFTKEAREAEAQQKALAKATEEMNDKLKAQRDIANEVVTANRSATTELAVFAGQMTQLEADIQGARDEAADTLSKQFEKQDEIIKKKKEDLAIVEKAKQGSSRLTDEENERLKILVASSEKQSVKNALSKSEVEFGFEMRKLSEELNGQLSTEINFRNKIRETNEDTLQKRTELLTLQEQYKEEQEEEAKRQEAIQKARAAALERERQLIDAINDAKGIQESTNNRIFQLQTNRLSDEEKINELANKRTEEIDEELKALEEQFEAMESIVRTKKDKIKLEELDMEAAKAYAALTAEQNEIEEQRLFELAELKKKLREKEQKEEEKANKKRQKDEKEALEQYLSFSKLQIQAITDVFTFGLQLATEAGEKNKTLINVLFRANQAASLANIAMSTAEAIAKAPSQYGTLAPLAIPAIVASGAVQAGVVLSQKPPLHMGGIVQPLAPDEQNRTLLTGEAVLDRATTRRLGEDGVRDLQNGKNMSSNVIVMNPFKHLDRYNRSALRNPNSSFSKLQPTRRSRY